MFSGVVIDTAGYILTSAHSMMPGQTYQVRFPDGKTHHAKGLGRILSNDAGLLKITDAGIWAYSKMGALDQPGEGTPCIGISYAGSLGLPEPNIRFGYIAGSDTKDGTFRSTCLMEPGDSGGPVFDLAGNVIGIHSRIELAPDRNFEIPVGAYQKNWKALQNPQTYQTEPENNPTLPATFPAKPLHTEISQINEALKKNEAAYQRSVLQVSSQLGGIPSLALATLVKPKRSASKKIPANKSYLVSKSSLIGEQPVIHVGDKRIQAKVVMRGILNDLVLLEMEYEMKNGVALNSVSAKEKFHEIGTFLISVKPGDNSYISVLGNDSATVPYLTQPGFLRAAVEMKDGHVTVKDTLSTNPVSKSMLQNGDQLLSVNKKEIKSIGDLRAETSGHLPGNEVSLIVMRSGIRMEIQAELYSISDFVFHIADQFTDGRSKKRYGFEHVFIHDGQLKPSECGGPVFDSKGKFYGINIARFSRTSTLAIPAKIVSDFVTMAFESEKLSFMFDQFNKRMNMKFKFPKGMLEEKIIDSTIYRPHKNAGSTDGIFYKIKPEDSDNLSIAFALYDSGPVLLDTARYGYTSKSFAHKLNYLLDTRPLFEEKNGEVTKVERSYVLDSTRMTIFTGRELKKFGADCAGMVDVPVDIPYLGKYHKMKILFMQKDTEGEAYVYYFYNDGVDIDKYLKETKYMWIFNF